MVITNHGFVLHLSSEEYADIPKILSKAYTVKILLCFVSRWQRNVSHVHWYWQEERQEVKMTAVYFYQNLLTTKQA